MHKYTTVLGDQWDLIAYREMGSESFTHLLIAANSEYSDVGIFGAGVVLTIPDVPTTAETYAPPWRRSTT